MAVPARDRVLLAAADLFARHGVRAVGVDRITASAGVAKATFYRHFRSKDELVAAWLRSRPPRWFDELRDEAARRASDPREQLTAFFDGFSEMLEAPGFTGCPFLNTAAELHGPSPAIHQAVVDYLAEIEAYLRDLATAGGFPAPESLGAQLRLVVSGALITALALGDATPVAAAARSAVNEILGGE